MTLEEKQTRMIAEINKLGDCFEQYAYLIFKSGQLPPMPEALRTDENLVSGCQSVVWLSLSVADGRMYLEAATDTLIIAGVLQILRELLEGEPAAEIAGLNIRLFSETELSATFTSDRNTGVKSILKRIQETAQSVWL